MDVAALVSGGVDSSVVVHRLCEEGYKPAIFYIRIGMEDEDGYIDCPAEEDIELTTLIARRYGCPFEVVDLHKEYWERVVSYTVETVRRGLTRYDVQQADQIRLFRRALGLPIRSNRHRTLCHNRSPEWKDLSVYS